MFSVIQLHEGVNVFEDIKQAVDPTPDVKVERDLAKKTRRHRTKTKARPKPILPDSDLSSASSSHDEWEPDFVPERVKLSSSEPPKKRGRGRPPKNRTEVKFVLCGFTF